jgi:hypothetical protein
MIGPFRIEPDAIYDDAALVLGLGLTTGVLSRERDIGRLRFTRLGRRVLYRGAWILDWLNAGTSTRRGSQTQEGVRRGK